MSDGAFWPSALVCGNFSAFAKTGRMSLSTGQSPLANCGGVPGNYCYGGEKIPHACITYSAATCPSVPQGTTGSLPLVPHRRTVTIRGIPYTIANYVTYYLNDSTNNEYRITSIVSCTAGIL